MVHLPRSHESVYKDKDVTKPWAYLCSSRPAKDIGCLCCNKVPLNLDHTYEHGVSRSLIITTSTYYHPMFINKWHSLINFPNKIKMLHLWRIQFSNVVRVVGLSCWLLNNGRKFEMYEISAVTVQYSKTYFIYNIKDIEAMFHLGYTCLSIGYLNHITIKNQ